MFFWIEESLKETEWESVMQGGKQYVAVLTSGEWKKYRDGFDLGIEIDPDTTEIYTTKAEVNYDSLTGSFSIPNRKNFAAADSKFAFVLDEKGIVFIDDGRKAAEIVETIRKTKKWRFPGLERFISDFLDQIIKDDLRLMEGYERELNSVETRILMGEDDLPSDRLNDIRSDIRDLRIHYEQLIDLGQELEENENNFFKQENLRYFRLFLNRMARLHDTSASLRDYTVQIRDLYKAHLDIKQNRIITVLTVVTSVFLPLTLIVGWYGMNFRYMPELEWKWGYPVIIAVSIAIVAGSLLFFHKKKWLS